MDEFDVGDGGIGLVGDFLLELFDSADHCKVHIKGDGLLFGGGLEQELNHLKNNQILKLNRFMVIL